MNLGQLINAVKGIDPDYTFDWGICNPHSYRGFYECVAFERRWSPQTAAEMLGVLTTTVGRTFQGWKGGDYTMDEGVRVYLANQGDTGQPIEGIGLVLGERSF